MEFIENFHPHMVGMGPFLPHHQTPFATQPAGSIQTTLFLMSLCRIMIPNLLLPATTALDSGENHGRMQAILAGANVVMPNLSPKEVRKGYLLYDGKPGLSQDAAESLNDLKKQVETIGYRIICGRGDYQEMRDKL
jgi:biotin synthase